MKTSSPNVPDKLNQGLLAAIGLGVLVLAVTAVVSRDRAWANALTASYFLVTLGLGGALFIALTTVSGAGWNVAFRRVPEALMGLLPASGILVLAVLAVRLPDYAWHHHGEGNAGTFWFKEVWLDSRFFAIRAMAYVLLWIAFAKWFASSSRGQDAGGASEKRLNIHAAVAFLAVFAVTSSLAGIDWIMALEPMWFSTMWGVYQFAGTITAALAAIILACVFLRNRGPLAGVFRDDHLHDLGKLLIGFCCFWMYIWFSQYMLIWYSNIPEETSYFILRTQGSWGPVVVGLIVLNWVIPLFMLLPRPSKRSERVMVRVAVVILIGRWLDLYVMIFPPVTGPTPVFGLPELAGICLICGLAGWLFLRSFAKAAPVPQNDPFLAESLQYHN